MAFSSWTPCLFYISLVDFFTVFFSKKRFPSSLISFWWKIVFWLLEVLICYLVDLFLFASFENESLYNLQKRELHCKDIFRDFGRCESKLFLLFSTRLNSAAFMVKGNVSPPKTSNPWEVGIFSRTGKNRGLAKSRRVITHLWGYVRQTLTPS